MEEILLEQYQLNPEFWFTAISELSSLLDNGIKETVSIGDFLNALRNVENHLEVEAPTR